MPFILKDIQSFSCFYADGLLGALTLLQSSGFLFRDDTELKFLYHVEVFHYRNHAYGLAVFVLSKIYLNTLSLVWAVLGSH